MAKYQRKKKNQVDKIKGRVIDGLLNAGVINQRQREVQKAEECYRMILELDPLNFNGLYMLGVLHAECGKMQDALEFLNLCLSKWPMIH